MATLLDSILGIGRTDDGSDSIATALQNRGGQHTMMDAINATTNNMMAILGMPGYQGGQTPQQLAGARQNDNLTRLYTASQLSKAMQPDYENIFKVGEMFKYDPEYSSAYLAKAKELIDAGESAATAPFNAIASLEAMGLSPKAKGIALTGTENIMNRLIEENPNLTQIQALQLVQGLARQGMQPGVGGEFGLAPGVADALASREAAEKRGQVLGAAQGASEVKEFKAPEQLEDIRQAKELLPKATGGGLAVAGKEAAAFFNVPTEGSRIDAELGILSGRLVAAVPRFEGPQSDKDTALYKEMAGDIDNTKKPTADRIAALNRMEKLLEKYNLIPAKNDKGSNAAVTSRKDGWFGGVKQK